MTDIFSLIMILFVIPLVMSLFINFSIFKLIDFLRAYQNNNQLKPKKN